MSTCCSHTTSPETAAECTGLPGTGNFTTRATFPVSYGTEVTVSCDGGLTLLGGNTLTCTNGETFTNTPICSGIHKEY